MTQQGLTADGTGRIEPAPAKLNLGLRVLSRRQDGFHDLVGLFQTVSLADEVVVTPAPRPELHCSDPSLPAGRGNLAWRAAELYRQRFGGGPWRIELTKRIPAGAGLGGGSADAAAVLRAVDALSDRPRGPQALTLLGAELGSDVPFAVRGGTRRVEGRGEGLTPVDFDAAGLWYLLVCPPEPVDTGWAYAELARRRASGDDAGLSKAEAYSTFICSARGGRLDAGGLWSVLHNDFQSLVESAKPIVARASLRLAETDPLACSMSGSGSTVYGIYDDRIVADRAAEVLRGAGYPVFLCTPVSGSIDERTDARSFNW